MLLLLPKSLFLLCFLHFCNTCSPAFGWFRVCFTYLTVLGKQALIPSDPSASVLRQEEFCPGKSCTTGAVPETQLRLCRSVWQPVCTITACSERPGSRGKAARAIRNRPGPSRRCQRGSCGCQARGCSGDVLRAQPLPGAFRARGVRQW